MLVKWVIHFFVDLDFDTYFKISHMLGEYCHVPDAPVIFLNITF